MKTRKSNPTEKTRDATPDIKKAEDDSTVDQLGIQRGQNGEKGNTVNPANIPPANDIKEASH